MDRLLSMNKQEYVSRMQAECRRIIAPMGCWCRRSRKRRRISGVRTCRKVGPRAVCLRNHLEELPLERVLLDFYHLSEHVGDAGVNTPGPETGAWLTEVFHAVRHEGCGRLRAIFCQAGGLAKRPASAQAGMALEALYQSTGLGDKHWYNALWNWNWRVPGKTGTPPCTVHPLGRARLIGTV